MKLPSRSLLVAIAASGTHASLADVEANKLTCLNRYNGAWKAITAFCAHAHVDTGSEYAIKGATAQGTNGATTAYIIGKCPADQTWVPQEYCLSQFWYTCADPPQNEGRGYKKFGHDNCQEFNLKAAEMTCAKGDKECLG